MYLPEALRVGADLGYETSFIGEAAELPPDRLSIALAKPMVRRAPSEPGLWLSGFLCPCGFSCLSAPNPTCNLFLGSGLQTLPVQVV